MHGPSCILRYQRSSRVCIKKAPSWCVVLSFELSDIFWIATTSFEFDWIWWHIQVIFTNESNIERWKNKRQAAVDSKIGRLENFIKLVKVPIQVVYMLTVKPESLAKVCLFITKHTHMSYDIMNTTVPSEGEILFFFLLYSSIDRNDCDPKWHLIVIIKV